MKIKNKKEGFTLIEVVIAISIFAVLAIMTTQVFSNVSRMSKKIYIQEYVFTEAEAAMEKILREVERSAIDYEEYYSRLVLDDDYYGQNYGAYGATFYYPGSDGPIAGEWDYGGDGVMGSDCEGVDDEYFFTESCEDFDYYSYDIDYGRHPYSSWVGDEDEWNAFCADSADCSSAGQGVQDELYLIDSSGTRKVMVALELQDDSEGSISMLEMDGFDVDGDSISDYWACHEDYDCSDAMNGEDHEGNSVPYAVPEGSLDLPDGGVDDGDFEPITPENLNVVELKFFVVPFEDPYRAFSETSDAVQQHPHVIVVMTVEPSEDLTEGLLGDDWQLTIQGVASSAVFDIVPSEYRGAWRWN